VGTRLFDLVVTLALLAVHAPILAATITAQRLEGRVPTFWRSPRLGRGGKQFELLTFTTMLPVEEAPPGANPDERQTVVGPVIRNYSIDGLLMLFNVLRGDLSTIGPRPMVPERVDLADPCSRRVLSVKPGVASYAILRLGRTYNRAPTDEKLRLEIEYADRQSLQWEPLRAIVASRWKVKSRE
jgi:lipopolysaccharide/colanic/teichoic acid biosynthesis glycosyltransferase